ncbi:MAG: hypothetical protein QXP03_00135 [Desulfurococcaceae archaeon]
MSFKLTREGAYGHVSVLIAKSPNLALLSDIVKSSEPADIQTAISRGIVKPAYSVLLQTKTLGDAEDVVYNFYRSLFSELESFMPLPYNSYVKRFIEIFDLDKIASVALSAERRKLELKYFMGCLAPLVEYLIHAKKPPKEFSPYISCLGVSGGQSVLDTVRCLIKVYLERVVDILSSVARLEPVENSRRVFYVFSLLRFYRYVVNSRLLKEMCDVELKDFAKRVNTPSKYIQIAVEVAEKLEKHVKEDPTLLTVHELKAVYELLKHLLYTPHSLIDRLTYLLVHKYYEVPFIRYLALHKYIGGDRALTV